MSFNAACRWWHLWLCRQLRPCIARASTSDPQWQQVWELHRGVAQAQINCHHDCLVLHTVVKGRNWQGFQLGPPLLKRLSRQARALWLGADSKSLSAADVTVTLSQDFWCDRAPPSGGGWLWPFDHCASTSSQLGREHHKDVSVQCSALGQWRQRLEPDRLMVLLAVRFLCPTRLTLLGVWPSSNWGLHFGSKWMLAISLTMTLRWSSYSWRPCGRKRGAVLRQCSSFGRAKECF